MIGRDHFCPNIEAALDHADEVLGNNWTSIGEWKKYLGAFGRLRDDLRSGRAPGVRCAAPFPRKWDLRTHQPPGRPGIR